MELFLFCIFSIAGISCLVVCLFYFMKINNLKTKKKNCTQTVNATIVEVGKNIGYKYQQEIVKNYYAIVKYEIDGKEYKTKSLSRPKINVYQEKNIKVYCDPHEKNICYDREGEKEEIDFHIIIVLILGVCLLIGGISFIV